MKILGAILAGGQSRRFGSDKAAATWNGKALLDHVADALRPTCAELIVVGRTWPTLESIADHPAPGLGPLGGLAGALCHARDHGFDFVLSSGCDLAGLPADLAVQLSPGPSILADIPIVGMWPVQLAQLLLDWMADPAHRSVYRFADHAGARRVATPASIINANRPSDLPQDAATD
jgi:molybdopterin-guanine dinucleotide biosynthesis protein A